ncbi:DNA polymerase alpha accessory factor Mcl1, partial [Massospora cicadina]
HRRAFANARNSKTRKVKAPFIINRRLMEIPTPQTFYAHSEGQTVLAFSRDGRRIFTGGSDSLVRSFNTNVELRHKDVMTLEKHSEPITCLVTNKDSFFTGSEDKTVAKFDAHSLTFQSFVAKCPSAIRCLALQPQQSGQRGQEQRQLLAMGSDDAVVRVVNIGTGIFTPLTNLSHAAASLAFHPDGKSLVALTVQGTVALLDPTGIAPARYSDVLARSCRTDRGDDGCRIAFHPLGNFVAVPAAKAGEILLVGGSDLQLIRTLTGGHTQAVTACAWSPNGRFLATTGKDRQLVIWRVDDWSRCLSLRHEAVVTCLAWSPVQNMLALANEDGSLILFDDILSQVHGYQQAEWAYNTDVDLELKPKPSAASQPSQAPPYMVQHESALSMVAPALSAQFTPDKAQICFQPAATQMVGSEKFLALNAFGSLKASYASGQNRYTFASHDGRLMYDFEDDLDFTLGALDFQGVVLAKPASKLTLASFYYRQHGEEGWHFGLSFRKEKISSPLPPLPTVLSFRAGIQLGVSMAPSATPVALVSDMKDTIFHAFHISREVGRLRLGYQLYNLRSKCILGQGDLVMASNSALVWIGFTNEGLPAIAESDGLVRVLVDPYVPNQASWRPVAKFEPHLNHLYSLSKGELHCLQKDANMVLNPAPLTLPWSIESATTLFSQPKVESEYLMSRLFADMAPNDALTCDELERQHLVEDRLLLQLLLKACQGDRPQQAVETILRLNCPQSLDFAHEIALRSKHLDIVRRIHDIRRERAAQ